MNTQCKLNVKRIDDKPSKPNKTVANYMYNHT